MAAYVVTPEAASDLLQIWLYIAADDEQAAERVEAEFYEKLEALARMPGLGHRRPDYTPARVLFFPRTHT
jgi:toxin ParE1/3/4